MLIPGLSELRQHFKGQEYCNPKFSLSVMMKEGVEEAITFLERQESLPRLTRSTRLLTEYIGAEGCTSRPKRTSRSRRGCATTYAGRVDAEECFFRLAQGL